jgi:DNA-binding response OmpR family regulator
LLILDWSMPKKDGLETLKWMQGALQERPPVIMMTNRTAKQDISDALNAGADDYITKPEDRSVIMARINAMLRRNAGSGAFDTKATYGQYELDRIDQTVSYANKSIAMTAKEFEPRSHAFAKLHYGNDLADQCGARHADTRHAYFTRSFKAGSET